PGPRRWRAGRAEGLKRYCTPQNAYDAGLGGNRLRQGRRHPGPRRWRAGRAEGLKRYCTPQNAYDAGLGGNRLNPVCPASDRLRLALAEEQGLRVHAVRREIDRLDYANASDEARLDDLLTGELDKDDRRRIRKLRRDIEDRNYEIRRLEREAQLSRPGVY
ncbi:hypothetical protein CNY89_17420, partial [Amaricoccus sp. HAR-UPW-R2A-40]